MPNTISFDSHGVALDGWHFPAADDSLAGPHGRPVVVMAHGFGGTKDSGLEGFAKELASAGADVLAFDYRGFGSSEGQPRQVISLPSQAEDYRAAIRAAAALPGVDPQRIALWGVSMAGGTVIEVAADRDDIAAVISLTPMVSGIAAARHAAGSTKPATSLSATLAGARDLVTSRFTRRPVTVPLTAEPGKAGMLALPGMYEEYLSIAGPTWENKVAASISLSILTQNPGKHAARLRCPSLFQIADFDRCAPPRAAAHTAVKARAQVRHYPCDHFDVYPGKEWHDRIVDHQVRFLRQVLAPAGT